MTQPLKRCTKCENEFPATPEYFHRHNQSSSGLSPRCKTCLNTTKRQTYVANSDVFLQRQREYYYEHRDERRSYNREWRMRNQEYRRKYNREHYQRNRDERIAYSRAYHLENRERILPELREYYRQNIDKLRAYDKKRARRYDRAQAAMYYRVRYMRLRAGDGITPQDVEQQIQRQAGACYWCSLPTDTDFEVDHVIPLSRGGVHAPNNIVIACKPCNRSKGAKLPYDEWEPPNPLKADVQ